jgi:hypothetical protein|tara:strand:+ start:198 stop:1208 length:1011 start_codon:yes stop_codon:yes gene_type:complete
MQEEAKNEEVKKDQAMVDIDTSGPGANVELEKEKPEIEIDTKDSSDSTPAAEPVEEKQEASDEKPEETQEEKPVEKKKEELETYSKDVQRRIAKLTKKWREAQRQADEALSFAKIQKEEKEKIQKKYSSVEQAGVKDREERIRSGLQAAAAKLTAAREAGDIAAEVEASKDIARLGSEENDLMRAKAMREEVVKADAKDTEIPKATAQPARPDPRAEAWGAKNTWFGKDEAMTYTAFSLHKKLVEEEGFDPQSDEYYAEIDKRMSLAFPQKFDNNDGKVSNDTAKPTQIVASAKRSVNKTGRQTVRLTPSEVAIAKKLGVPLEEYAKQKRMNTKEV